jgi:hypothetical protein
MTQHFEMPQPDLAHCLRKEIEYYAKATGATNPALKSAYEATAREYAHQGRELKEIKKL